MSATPRPWKWDGKVWDYDCEQEAPWLTSAEPIGHEIPIITGDLQCSQENAEFIVLAVNSYDALREALEPFAKFAEYMEKHPRIGLADDLYGWDNTVFLRQSDCMAALSALKLAKEGQ